MDKNFFKQVAKTVDFLIGSDAKTVAKIMSPKLVIRATRTLFRNKIDKRGNIEITLTIGKPNVHEREFIKDCKIAEEPFPVRQYRVKFPPKKRK